MSRIVRFHQIGGPENLKIEDVPDIQPGEGEIRLRVQAVGLNRAESMFYRGAYMDRPEMPSRIGYEASGIIEAVGPGADSVLVGKQISTMPVASMNKYGVLGETAIVPTFALAEYPSNLSPSEGSAIWMQYLTAYGALVHIAKVGAGDTVLITAASSSVGIAAIQMVKDAGGTVVAATRTSAKRKDLLELGADFVIAIEEEDLVQKIEEITGGKGVRVIFDPIAGPIVEKLAQSASVGGIVFEYGWLSQAPTPFPLFSALRKGVSIRGYSLFEFQDTPEVFITARKYIYDRLADSRFHPIIAKIFSLDQVVEAYQFLESNAQIGKIVITI